MRTLIDRFVAVTLRCATCLAALSLGMGALSSSARAGEPTVPPPILPPPVDPDETPMPPVQRVEGIPDIDWSATKQSFAEEKGAIVLSGSAWVKYQGAKLEADNIVFFRQTKEVYAEGNIRLRVGESELAAEAAYIDINTDSGYLIDATVRVSANPNIISGFTETKTKDTEPTTVLKTRDQYGLYYEAQDDPQARTNIVFQAQKIIKHGPLRYTADDAFVTTDEMAHPMYGVNVGSLELNLKEVARDPKQPDVKTLRPSKVIAKRARLNILGFQSFPFPTVSYDLLKRNTFYSINYGNSNRWGPYGLIRLGYGLAGDKTRLFDPQRVYLDLDYRHRRGPAGGFELEWFTGVRPKVPEGETLQFDRGSGHIRTYVTDESRILDSDDIVRARRDLERRIQPKIDGFPRRQYDSNLLFAKRRRLDDTGPPSFELDRHGDDIRGLVDFEHHQPILRFAGVDDLQMDFRFKRQTDRDFMLEYFYNNYLQDNQPEALASVRKAGDNYSIELLYRGNPQEFDGAPARDPLNYGTFTNYQPALTYSLTPTPLKYGFYLESELQVANLQRDFERSIYDNDGFDSGRLYGKFDISRPMRWGPINFVPHLGTQQQAYTNSRAGNEVYQGALTYGMDATSRIYGTFADLENDALGLTGMRHIMEPRISYRAVGDTRESAEDLLDFDEVDDLTPVDKVTFAFDQTFQTRRKNADGTLRTVNVAGFDMAADFYPRERDQQRLLNNDNFDLLRMDGFLRVLDVVRLDGSLGFRTEDVELETAAYGLTIDPNGRWRLKFEERFHFQDNERAIRGSDQYRLKFEYKLSERWDFNFETIHEQKRALLTKKGRQIERIGFGRHYGPFTAVFGYSVDRNLNDHGFFFTLKPELAYRNLVVSAQDKLVPSVEAGGDLDAPEERNFDPFDLYRKREEKRKEKKERERLRRAQEKDGVDEPETPAPPPPTSRGKSAPKPAGSVAEKQPVRRGAFEDPDAPVARPKAAPRKVDEDDWTTPALPASARPNN